MFRTSHIQQLGNITLLLNFLVHPKMEGWLASLPDELNPKVVQQHGQPDQQQAQIGPREEAVEGR